MNTFLRRFAHLVTGVLSGFDCFFGGRCGTFRTRLVCNTICGTIASSTRSSSNTARRSRQVAASQTLAEQTGRPVEYLRRSTTDKEALAKQIAARDRIGHGLIAIFKSVEPCMSFEIHKNHASKKLEIKYRERKCLYV
jgi:hypothetical protein